MSSAAVGPHPALRATFSPREEGRPPLPLVRSETDVLAREDPVVMGNPFASGQKVARSAG
jgi:hypothetical protein